MVLLFFQSEDGIQGSHYGLELRRVRFRSHHLLARMFVNQLRLAVAAQQQREMVEPGDDSLKLDPLDEEHRHLSLVPPHGVEKKILKILALIGHIGRSEESV